MYKITSKLFLRLSIMLALFFGVYFSQNSMADEHEVNCVNNVQNKVAWGSGKTKWDQANVNKLCQGTKMPKEPGECFKRLMSGKVSWGTGTKWKWQNAISLCSGTDSADETISCFQQRVGEGVFWSTAILQCQLSTKGISYE